MMLVDVNIFMDILERRDGWTYSLEIINKVKTGLTKACEKRPVSTADIEKTTYEIESELLKKKKKEVKSSEIGELIMKKLKKLDKVAYVRFASVYKEFEDVSEFKKELDKLRK